MLGEGWRRRTRRTRPAAASLTGLAALLTFGGVAAGAPAGAPITIAVEGPLSGPQASTGRDMLRGVRLAVREANGRAGVLGHPVVIVQADDRADPGIARRVAARVISSGAVAVIGPYNSAVGLENLRTYLRGRVVPVHLTSTDATSGLGVTVQPKNAQVAPVEDAYIRDTGATRVAMLVDPSAFTTSQADRLAARLRRRGVSVTRVPLAEGKKDYSAPVAAALASTPDLVYSSTYFPEGARIARALAAAAAPRPRCLMGFANVDSEFVTSAGLAASDVCRFIGIPAAGQLPTARDYSRRYRRAFGVVPGVWGVFAYDSARLLFRTMERTGGVGFGRVLAGLRSTRGFRGATGPITIDPATGNRVSLPLSALRVNARRLFVIDASPVPA